MKKEEHLTPAGKFPLSSKMLPLVVIFPLSHGRSLIFPFRPLTRLLFTCLSSSPYTGLSSFLNSSDLWPQYKYIYILPPSLYPVTFYLLTLFQVPITITLWKLSYKWISLPVNYTPQWKPHQAETLTILASKTGP